MSAGLTGVMWGGGEKKEKKAREASHPGSTSAPPPHQRRGKASFFFSLTLSIIFFFSTESGGRTAGTPLVTDSSMRRAFVDGCLVFPRRAPHKGCLNARQGISPKREKHQVQKRPQKKPPKKTVASEVCSGWKAGGRIRSDHSGSFSSSCRCHQRPAKSRKKKKYNRKSRDVHCASKTPTMTKFCFDRGMQDIYCHFFFLNKSKYKCDTVV